jgi:hypothetical protein
MGDTFIPFFGMRSVAGTGAGLSSRGPDEGGQRAGHDLVELLGGGAIGAFDGAVEFGGAWRKNEPMEAALLAGLFELGGKLRAAIDLDGADMENGMRCCKVSRN